MKGSAEDVSSFLKCDTNEALSVAYLRINDIGTYRRLKLSFPVIETFLWMKEAGHVNRSAILELMSGAELDIEWPLGTDIAVKFPVVHDRTLSDDEAETNSINRDNVHAFAVAHVIQTFENWDEISEQEKEERQETAIQKFEEVTKMIFPRSDYDIKLVQQPILQHDESLGESPLEGINRALMLIYNFRDNQYSRRWKPAYVNKKSGDPFKQKDCSDHTPYWMTQQAAEEAISKPVALPSRTFEGVWVAKGADSKDLLDHFAALEEENIQPPDEAIKQLPDPRHYEDGDRYRDMLRTRLDCKKYSMKLNRLLLEREGKGELRVWGYGSSDKAWLDICDIFHNEPGPFRFVLHMGKSDDAAEEYETDQPPLQLEELFQQVDNKPMAKPTHLATTVEDEKNDPMDFTTDRLHDKTIGYTTPKAPQDFYPDRAEMLQQYDNYDADTPEGLRKWQKRAFQRLGTGQKPAPKERNVGKFKQEEFDETQGASKDGIRNLISQDVVNDETVTPAEYKAVTSGFTGSSRQLGPLISHAIAALGFELDEKATTADIARRNCYRCTLLPTVKRRIFEWQISAMADILVKSVGRIPVDGVPEDHLQKADVVRALTALRGPAIFGHLNADQTGLGKTISELFALSWMAKYCYQLDKNGARIYLPTLINVPKQVAGQWIDEIIDYFPNLDLVISAGETKKTFGPLLAKRVVKSSAVIKRFPRAGAPLRFANTDIEAVLDKTNPKAAFAVWLSTYETFNKRHGWTKLIPNPTTGKVDRDEYRHNWQNKFRIIICDEAHKIRNVDTMSWEMMKQCNAEYTWLMTATPIVNDSTVSGMSSRYCVGSVLTDNIGLARLWRAILARN